MRIGSSSSGIAPGFALIAMMIGTAACSAGGSTTVISDGTTPTPAGTTPGDGTTKDPAATNPAAMGDPTNPATPTGPLVNGVSITDVAFFQGVKVAVVTAGKVVTKSGRNAPVVVGRPAAVRVYVKSDSSYKGSSVTAQLQLVDGTKRLPILSDTKTVSGTSTDDNPQSTFNFEVPADSLPAGVTYQVLLTAKDGTVPTGDSAARFPTAGGVQALDAEVSGKLKVVIVPVKYMYDSSGRVPDTSAAQLALYKQAFMVRYPATDVEVTARAAWSYSQRIAGSGTGFDTVLNAVTQLRQSDGVANDVYYYGALAPAQSFNSFCGGGCVTGLSTVDDSAKTAYLRASVGIGFTGNESAETATHEVGHAHGRNHAPCGGAQGVDPQFPYSNGSIGVWGYDIIAKTFLSPSVGTDMMGYCDNTWVSDYTYSALFDRIAAVNGNPPGGATGGGTAGGGMMPAAQTYRTASVGADGTATWTGSMDLAEEPTSGQSRTVTFYSDTGSAIGTHTAHFYPYDHLPGGMLVVPTSPSPVSPVSAIAAKSRVAPTWSSVRIAGVNNVISH